MQTETREVPIQGLPPDFHAKIRQIARASFAGAPRRVNVLSDDPEDLEQQIHLHLVELRQRRPDKSTRYQFKAAWNYARSYFRKVRTASQYATKIEVVEDAFLVPGAVEAVAPLEDFATRLDRRNCLARLERSLCTDEDRRVLEAHLSAPTMSVAAQRVGLTRKQFHSRLEKIKDRVAVGGSDEHH